MLFRNKRLLFLLFITCVLLLPVILNHASAHETDFPHEEPEVTTLKIPENIQKIQEYNQQQALFYLRNISLIIAFLAGALSLLSPCILPILPAFFAYSFKEKRNIAKMTFIFFIGFAIIFIMFGLVAAAIGQSIAEVQLNNLVLSRIAGFFFILLGSMALLGKGFSSFFKADKLKSNARNDKIGVFLFGIAFAIGWSACLGPILAGILLMAGILKNFLYASLLLFSYSFGIFIPLFILAFLGDRYDIAKKPFFKREIKFGKLRTNPASLMAGLLFIFLGIIFIFFGGTSFTHLFDPFGTTLLFNELQDKLIGLKLINIIGLIIFILIFVFLIKVMRKRKDGKKQKFDSTFTLKYRSKDAIPGWKLIHPYGNKIDTS